MANIHEIVHPVSLLRKDPDPEQKGQPVAVNWVGVAGHDLSSIIKGWGLFTERVPQSEGETADVFELSRGIARETQKKVTMVFRGTTIADSRFRMVE